MSLSQMPERIPLGNGLTYRGEETLAELTEGILNLTGKGMVIDGEDEKRALVILRDQLKARCEKGDFKAVRDIADEILDIDAKCGDAYYYLLLAEYQVTKGTMLADLDGAWMESSYYKYALRFGDETLKNRLEAIRERYELRMEDAYVEAENERKQAALEEHFQRAQQLMAQYQYGDAKKILVSNAYRHPKAQQSLEICNLGIEAQNRIGDRKTYLRRMLEQKNPRLFGKWRKVLADRENLQKPIVTMRQGAITAGGTVIGILLGGLLSSAHPYLAVLLCGALGFYCGSACGKTLLAFLSGPLCLFSLLLEWGADGGRNKGIGAMVMSTFLIVLTVFGVIAMLRWKTYEANEKGNQAVIEEVNAFFEKEMQELVKRYQPVLGKGFMNACGPKR